MFISMNFQIILEDFFEGHQSFDLIDFETSEKLFRCELGPSYHFGHVS